MAGYQKFLFHLCTFIIKSDARFSALPALFSLSLSLSSFPFPLPPPPSPLRLLSYTQLLSLFSYICASRLNCATTLSAEKDAPCYTMILTLPRHTFQLINPEDNRLLLLYSDQLHTLSFICYLSNN